MDAIDFMVPGEAVPWARTGGGKSGVRFTPPKQRSYAGSVKLFCQNAMGGQLPFAGPIELHLCAVYAWPASWSARRRTANGPWKTSRGDLSNVEKLVEDALNAVAYGDDAQIVVKQSSKVYGDRPSLRVVIRRLGTDEARPDHGPPPTAATLADVADSLREIAR